MLIGIGPRDKEYLLSYFKVVKKFGFEYIVITEENIDKYLERCQGFILPGGIDFCECDYKIIKHAIDNDKPLMGICLGMQELAYFTNDSFFDNTVKNNTPIDHYCIDKKYAHKVKIFPNTIINDAIQENEIYVNSRHNYHVDQKDYFLIAGLAEDNIIEAIEIPSKKFIVGVQWHPEDMVEYDQEQYKLFQYFFKCCKKL